MSFPDVFGYVQMVLEGPPYLAPGNLFDTVVVAGPPQLLITSVFDFVFVF